MLYESGLMFLDLKVFSNYPYEPSNSVEGQVEKVVRDLCGESQMEAPVVSVTPNDELILALNSNRRSRLCFQPEYGSRGILHIPDDLIVALSEIQLKGVIAHEIAHSTQHLYKIKDFNRPLEVMAQMAASWVAYLSISSASVALAGGFFSSCLGLAAACGAFELLGRINSTLKQNSSRNNELATDLKALEIFPIAAEEYIAAIEIYSRRDSVGTTQSSYPRDKRPRGYPSLNERLENLISVQKNVIE